MIEFIPQCKGTDADKLKIADSEMFYASIKYDDIYIQIQKDGNEVRFFTSSGKEFTCSYADAFKNVAFDFKVETGYTVDGGKLGTRAKADQEIKKAVKDSSFELTGKFMIYDSLEDGVSRYDRDFSFPLTEQFASAFNYLMDFSQAKQEMANNLKDGWEGLFLVKPNHIQTPGKKSKDAVKLKHKFTADLVVTEIDGLWLSLVDEDGVVAKVQVNSTLLSVIKVGYVIEIEYEQIVKSYNVAVFKDIRFDKMAS